MSPDYSPLSVVWQQTDSWPGFLDLYHTPANDYAYCPVDVGSNSYLHTCTYDPQTRLVTLDITDAFNRWIIDPSSNNWGLVFIGPDESQKDMSKNLGYYEFKSLTYVNSP
jgi:hypothetical protein